ncbi:MAG: DUF6305 family protein [Longimicrobiales bacterium]
MMRLGRRAMGMAAITLFLLAGAGPLEAQDSPVTADLPVLLTSCGQSPGPTRIQFFLNRLDLQHEFLDMATAQDLADRQAAGNPVKTLIIVTGASLKGMGAAGVSMREELIRTEALIAEAKRQGILIIGAHVEGMARRAQGAAAGDNSDEQSIDAVMPFSDLLIVRKDGDEDRRFSIISETSGIPLLLFEKNMEMGDLLGGVFGG